MKKKTFICCILSASMIFASGILTSVYAADDTLTLADYPEYKDIVQQILWRCCRRLEYRLSFRSRISVIWRILCRHNKLGYFLQDIDNNGTAELFIGALDDGSDTYEEMFFDMYTLINGRLSLVTTSGERDRYYLCTDNTIANEGSGSAFNSVRQYYVYTNGQLNLKESVVYDSEKNPQNPWSFNTADSANGVTISESDAYSIMDNYEYTRIPFIALADMK